MFEEKVDLKVFTGSVKTKTITVALPNDLDCDTKFRILEKYSKDLLFSVLDNTSSGIKTNLFIHYSEWLPSEVINWKDEYDLVPYTLYTKTLRYQHLNEINSRDNNDLVPH